MRGQGDGESSATGEKQTGCRSHATTPRQRAACVEKAFRDPAHYTGDLAVAAPYRVSADNRARLRGGGCTRRNSDIRTRGCDPWNAYRLPRACRDLASAASSGTALTRPPRSLRRVWRTMTWPLSGDVVFALGTGLASGATAARVYRGRPIAGGGWAAAVRRLHQESAALAAALAGLERGSRGRLAE